MTFTSLGNCPLRTQAPRLALLSSRLLFNLESLFVHFFVEVLVVIIPIEQFFEFFLVKKLHILLDLVAIIVFPFTVCVVGVKIIFDRGVEWSWHSTVEELFPFEITEPGMILYIFWTV